MIKLIESEKEHTNVSCFPENMQSGHVDHR